MKQLKNYLVVLPLVLMFMLQALPVAVEAEESKVGTVKDEVVEETLGLPAEITLRANCTFLDKSNDLVIEHLYSPRMSDNSFSAKISYQWDITNDEAETNRKKKAAYDKAYKDTVVPAKEKAFKEYYNALFEDMIKEQVPAYLKSRIAGSYEVQDWDTEGYVPGNAYNKVKLLVTLKVSRNKDTFKIRAIDIRNKQEIVALDIEMTEVASSLHDAETAFREKFEGNRLKGMTFVKAERNKDLTASDLYYDSKVTPLTVLHILKGRAPLGEVVPVGLLPRNTEEANILVKEHKVIQGRIRQLATRGYQFDKIVYDDGYRRNPLVREYYDMDGSKVVVEDALPVLYIYYVPGTPAAANKKVEAAKAEDAKPSENAPVTAELQAPAPAVLGAVTANNPDPNEAHLPATGEQDHIVLLLSSVGLMIVGLFLSKKR